MNSVSLNNLWSYLQGLSLTASNQRWLAERLIESSNTQNESIGEFDADVFEDIDNEATAYSFEELNARIDEAEAEIESGDGKSFEEMMCGFKKELAWLK